MITEEEFLNKVSELMDKAKINALESAKALYHSGAIDKEDPEYTDNYILPKLFIVAYTSKMRYDWAMPYPKLQHKRTIKNIEHFI